MSRRGGARLAATLLALAALAALVVARRRLDVVEVRGRSMTPTLVPGDRLVVARLRPRPGDVVLAHDPRRPARELVKRVAAIDAAGVTLRGDNPAASTDARVFGPVLRGVVGWRAIFRYWPPDRLGPIRSRPPSGELGGEAARAFPGDLLAG